MVARMCRALAFVLLATACGGNAAATSAQAPAGSASAGPVNGWLDPPIIQSIVRRNFAVFARCYNDALRSNPHLRGRVTTKFVIDLDGTVPMVVDGGSDMPDENVVRCVVSHFRDLKFPEPKGGRVTVVYPIQFNPGDDPDAGAKADAQ
jgi:hypothetical protein